MFLLVAFGVPRAQVLACAVKPIREVSSMASAAMPCMVGRAHSTGIAMVKFHAGLDDWCVDALLISVRFENGDLVLSRLAASHCLPTIGNMS